MGLTGYSLSLLEASWMTIQLAFTSLAVGLVLAVIFAAGEMSRHKLLAWTTTGWVTLLRGLPEILVVLFIFFGSSQILFYITGDYIEVSPFLSGVIALSLIFSAYASQTIRGALKAVSKGQREAASALGLSSGRTFFQNYFATNCTPCFARFNQSMVSAAKRYCACLVVTPIDLLMVKFTFYKRSNNLIVH
ncbi:ABC transporter permease subunit, partial [Photobacterium damselae]|uniref:ABC transporter permease subunit n=1 Tax=Photobacterium damselae TaxID=38293 RepID=UPI001FD807F8